MSDIDWEPDLPDGWEPIDNLCYPRNDSKAYRREDGANAHIVNMYNTGRYNVQLETADGEWYDETHTPGRLGAMEEILAGQFGFSIGGMRSGTVAYLAAKADLERVVEHYEGTGEVASPPEEVEAA